MTEVAVRTRAERRARPALVDCDIHVQPKERGTLGRYLPRRWRRYFELFGAPRASGAYYPRANDHAARTDAWPPGGGPPGSDLPFLREQLLDRWGIEVGVLTPLLGSGGQRNVAFGEAFATAIN